MPKSDRFWKPRTLAEIVAEQGIKPADDLASFKADLWDSDEEFEEFLSGIYERRRQARGEGTPPSTA